MRSFAGFGTAPDLAHLVQGIEETVINRLSGQPDLVVMHMTDDRAIRPDFILEGSVRATPQGLSANVRVVDPRSGAILANEEVRAPAGDPLALEQAVERRILGALARDIAQAELTRRAKGYTESTAAFDLFLRAQAALLLRTPDGNRRAQRLYREAIAHDPRFARAYGGLALTLAADYRNGWTDDPGVLNEALKMALTALEIAPDLPEQYWVIGYVRTQQRRFADATEALDAALRLRPDYADAHALLGGIATYDGRPRDSVSRLRQAIRLRPRAGYLYYLLLGRAYYFLGDCDQAEINLAEALARNPDNVEAHLYHAACLVRAERLDDAEWERLEVLALEPDLTLASFFASYPMADVGQIRALGDDLAMAGFE